jgi:hypothetical protein
MKHRGKQKSKRRTKITQPVPEILLLTTGCLSVPQYGQTKPRWRRGEDLGRHRPQVVSGIVLPGHALSRVPIRYPRFSTSKIGLVPGTGILTPICAASLIPDIRYPAWRKNVLCGGFY